MSPRVGLIPFTLNLFTPEETPHNSHSITVSILLHTGHRPEPRFDGAAEGSPRQSRLPSPPLSRPACLRKPLRTPRSWKSLVA